MSDLLPLYVPEDATRTLDAAWIVCPQGVGRNKANGHRVKVGVMSGRGEASWVGTYDGAEVELVAGRPMRLTGAGRLARGLSADSVVVAHVETFGRPYTDLCLSVQIIVGSSVAAPAFRVQGQNKDYADAFSDLIDSGVKDRVVVCDVVAPAPWRQAKKSYDVDDQVITAGGALEATQVSITFTRPPGKTIGYAKVTGVVGMFGLVGSSLVVLAIGDGTTDHNSLAFSAPTIDTVSGVTGYAGEITATTTFTLRVSCTVNNVTLDRSLIYGTCVWV